LELARRGGRSAHKGANSERLNGLHLVDVVECLVAKADRMPFLHVCAGAREKTNLIIGARLSLRANAKRLRWLTTACNSLHLVDVVKGVVAKADLLVIVVGVLGEGVL
jgi:hypothetical protein